MRIHALIDGGAAFYLYYIILLGSGGGDGIILFNTYDTRGSASTGTWYFEYLLCNIPAGMDQYIMQKETYVLTQEAHRERAEGVPPTVESMNKKVKAKVRRVQVCRRAQQQNCNTRSIITQVYIKI